MRNFRKGDEVRHNNGGVYTVRDVRTDGKLRFEGYDDGIIGDPRVYTLVKAAGLQWADVSPGDKVTFEASTGEVLIVTATGHAYDSINANVLGRWVNNWPSYGTLLKIEKPAPPLPTTPDSKITDGLTDFVLDERGWWLSLATGTGFEPHRFTRSGNFRVLRDAAKDSK